MLIFGRDNWREQRTWCYSTLAVVAACIAWYTWSGYQTRGWPGGGSLPGLTFGIAGGLIMAFEMFLAVRKKYRAVRIGRVKLWLKAHIWLGLACFPILVLHSGFRWSSGPLAVVLMVLLTLVTLSGLIGLYLQQVVPKQMLDTVKAETIRSQIDHVLRQSATDAERLVRVTCGIEDEETDHFSKPVEEQNFRVVGAVRSSGTIQGRLIKTSADVKVVPETKPLHNFYMETIAPFLTPKPPKHSPMASARRASAVFADLRSRIDPAAHSTINTLEELCDQRRQFTEQARLHRWLHGWLCVHVPLSTALFLLMIAHIFLALKFF